MHVNVAQCSHDVVYIYAENAGRAGGVFRGGCPRGAFSVAVDTTASGSAAVVVEIVSDHAVTGAGLNFTFIAKTHAHGVVRNSPGGFHACPIAASGDPCSSREKTGSCTVKGVCVCSHGVIGEACTLPVLKCTGVDSASPLCGGPSSAIVVSPFGKDETGLGEVAFASGGRALQVKPFRSLRRALEGALHRRALSSGSVVIVLLPGRYDTCDLDMSGDVAVENVNAANDGSVVLSCANRGVGRGFSVSGRAVLSRVTIEGNASIAGGRAGDAGGVRVVTGGWAVFHSVTFKTCEAARGGAIFVESGAVAELVDSAVMDSVALENGGGVFLSENAVLQYIGACTIAGCRGHVGGAIFGGPGSVVNASGSDGGRLTLTNNVATSGGGAIGSTSSAGGVPMIVIGVVVTRGSAPRGGAVFVSTDGLLELRGVHISGSTAVLGGGIFVAAGGTVRSVGNTTIAWCTASRYGGGLYADREAQVMMDTSLISYCSAAVSGGGVFLSDSAAASVLLVSKCSSVSGGGISVSGDAVTFTGRVHSCTASEIGGGVFVDEGSIVMSGTIEVCKSSLVGGGIGLSSGNITGTPGALLIDSCFADRSGGAIFGAAGKSSVASARITDCIAGAGGALGVYGTSDAELTVVSASISRCGAHDGGGAYVGPAGTLVLLDDVIVHNCVATQGGGAFVDSLARLDGGKARMSKFSACLASNGGGVACSNCSGIVNTMITQCRADARGGGVFVAGATEVVVTQVQCSDNRAAIGGGMWLGDSLVFASDVALVRNTAQEFGGGIAVVGAVGRAAVFTVMGLHVTVGCSGNNARAGGNVYISGAGVELHGLVIVDGSASDGGGVFANETSGARIIDSTISGNVAEHTGGGVYVSGSSGLSRSSIEFENSVLERNSASEGGGGIFASFSDVALSRSSRVSDNSAPTGGGVLLSWSALSSGDGCSLDSNVALSPNPAAFAVDSSVASGGAVASMFGECNVTGVRLLAGRASNNGGGVFVSKYAQLRMFGAVVADCTSSSGGGVYVEGNGWLRVAGCSFHRNRAHSGGGAYINSGVVGGTFSCVSSTFEANYAASDGGAVTVNGGTGAKPANAGVDGCNFTENYAGQFGGALQVFGVLQMSGGCVSKGNTAGQNGGHVNIAGGVANIASSAFAGSLQETAFLCDETRTTCTYAGASKPVHRGEYDALAGAAIAVSGPSPGGVPSLVLTTSLIGFHVSPDGGTVTAVSSAIVVINATSFVSNFGGGVRSASASVVDIKACRLVGNSAKAGGGAVQCSGLGSILRVTGSRLERNFAGSGGALSVDGGGEVVVSGSIFVANSAVNSGGAVMVRPARVLICTQVTARAGRCCGIRCILRLRVHRQQRNSVRRWRVHDER